MFSRNIQYYKFSAYGFLKNLRFFDAFLMLFLLSKGLEFKQIGILYAVREIMINVFEIPSGFIADTYGRKNSLMVSFLLYIASFIIFYFSAGFWPFAFAFIFYGIADAFRSGTHKGMIMDYLKLNNWEDQKINYYGHTRGWSQSGSAVSSLIGGIIVFTGGKYENIFLFSIIPYLLNLILIYSYPSEIDIYSRKVSRLTELSLRSTIKSFYQAVKKPEVLKIINSSALHTSYLKAVQDYIQPVMVNVILILPLLNDTEIEKKNGLFIGIIYFVIYLLTSQASRTASKIESAKNKNFVTFTLLAGFIAGISCGLSYYFDLWWIALGTFVLIYIVENLRKPVLTGYVADNVPNSILTSVLSAQSLIKTIMTAAIALAFGFIADHSGIGISFIIISLFLIVTSMVISSLSWLKRK